MEKRTVLFLHQESIFFTTCFKMICMTEYCYSAAPCMLQISNKRNRNFSCRLAKHIRFGQNAL